MPFSVAHAESRNTRVNILTFGINISRGHAKETIQAQTGRKKDTTEKPSTPQQYDGQYDGGTSFSSRMNRRVYTKYGHRVDSVLESSLPEIIRSKNFALIKLSLKFCETTIYDNKVFIENLVAVQ